MDFGNTQLIHDLKRYLSNSRIPLFMNVVSTKFWFLVKMPKLKRGRGISQISAKILLKRARIRGSQRSLCIEIETSKSFVKETENGKKDYGTRRRNKVLLL